MKTKKWLFFATQADEVNFNGIDDGVCLPADNLVSISPTANNTVALYFKGVKNNDPLGAYDSVVLDTVVGDAFEVANELVRYINGYPHSDGFIVVADDTTTTDDHLLADTTIAGVYAHRSITGVNAINIGDASASYNDYPINMHYGVTPTAQPADTATLEVNNHYNFGTGTALGYRIPAAIDGRAGDWISVLYTARINDGVSHTFTTTTDAQYSAGSIIRVPLGTNATRGTFVDVSTTDDNVITIAGLDNGDGGIGTRLMFRNMTGGTNGWAVEAVIEGEDDGTVATTGTVFS